MLPQVAEMPKLLRPCTGNPAGERRPVQRGQTTPRGVAAHPLTLATQKSSCSLSQSPVVSQRSTLGRVTEMSIAGQNGAVRAMVTEGGPASGEAAELGHGLLPEMR